MAKPKSESVIPIEQIASRIYRIRGENVMLDSELAELYGVEAKALNQAVTRNNERFPEDFCFRLTWDEYESLRSQIVTLEISGRGRHRKYPPRAFTEQGVAMLSSVLRGKQAAEVNVLIMRTYVQMRKALADNAELARRVERIDRKVSILWRKFEMFINPPPTTKKRPIGFVHPPADDT